MLRPDTSLTDTLTGHRPRRRGTVGSDCPRAETRGEVQGTASRTEPKLLGTGASPQEMLGAEILRSLKSAHINLWLCPVKQEGIPVYFGNGRIEKPTGHLNKRAAFQRLVTRIKSFYLQVLSSCNGHAPGTSKSGNSPEMDCQPVSKVKDPSRIYRALYAQITLSPQRQTCCK